MKLIVYPLLSTRSRRSFSRKKTKWGHPHFYQPRIDLLARLSYELGMTKEGVLDQIAKEREYVLKILYG